MLPLRTGVERRSGIVWKGREALNPDLAILVFKMTMSF
jgi:hypothetical protein